MTNQSESGSYPRSDNFMPPLPASAPWHAPRLHPARVRVGMTWLRNDQSPGAPTRTGTATLVPPTVTVTCASPAAKAVRAPVALTLGRSLRLAAERAPGRPAVSCAGETLTHGELNALGNRIANGLLAAGLALGTGLLV